MINPSFQVQDELYIHAASEAVWQKFSRLEDWPRWNSEVLSASWVQGEAWKEGSIFNIRHKSLMGMKTTTAAVIRMCLPANTVVWESNASGIAVVNSASFADEVGGCKLTARHAYHGLPTLALRLLSARQQSNLENAMRELKGFVEGSPRR